MERRKEQYLGLLTRALQVLEPRAGGEGGRRAPGAAAAPPALWQRLAAAKRLDSKQLAGALHLLYSRINGRAAAKRVCALARQAQ